MTVLSHSTASRRAFLIAGLSCMSALAVCTDLPTGPAGDLSALIVSDTTVGLDAASGSAGAPSLTIDGEPTYVSLPSGAVPGGTHATVRNRRTLQAVERDFIDGGFDPIAIDARPGDELAIDVVRANGPTLTLSLVVPTRRRPRIVRTSPPRDKRDVPLNLRVSVVFSEPLDESFDGAPLRLMRGATEVNGRAELDADGLTLGFTPDVPLAAGTTYRLVISGDIRDRDGDSVDGPVLVDFTTGSSMVQASRVQIDADTLWALTTPYDFARLVAHVFDSDGNELLNHQVAWTSSDLTVLRTNGYGMFDGRNELSLDAQGRSGSATIHAIAGAARDSVVVVLEPQPLAAVSIGGNSLRCFISTENDAYCSGGNDHGELGSQVRHAQYPVRVAGGHKFESVSAGIWHACGVTPAGLAYCWGANHDGKVGPGAGSDVLLPQLVSPDLVFRQLSAGIYHTCGITRDGAAYCWGTQWGPESEGLPHPGPTSHSPVLVGGGHAFVQIDAGLSHSCGLTESGAAYCWGVNSSGQLGNGSTTSSAAPVVVAGDFQFRHVSAGWSHSCGVTTDGRVFCWGEEGAFSGYAAFLPSSTSPLQVPLPDGVSMTTVDIGEGPTCGVTTIGSAYCWGFVWDMTAVETGFSPTLLPGGIELTSIDRTCGVSREPAVYCWWFAHAEPSPRVTGPYRYEGQP